MRAVIRGVLVVLSLLPAALAAQGSSAPAGRHELGLDALFSYGKPSGGESNWVAGAPVDIRIGFVTTKPIMYQVSFSVEGGGGGGSSAYDGGVGLAALWAKDHHKGPFLDGNVAGSFSAATGSETGFVPSVGVGVGTRMPRGTAAIRLELTARYAFENSNGAPSAVRVGVRAGFSFWH